MIDDCLVYTSGSLSKCYTCAVSAPGFDGRMNDWSVCCNKEILPSTGGDDVCTEEITGCKVYSKTNIGTCHTCYDGFTNGAGATNEYVTCDCATGLIELD